MLVITLISFCFIKLFLLRYSTVSFVLLALLIENSILCGAVLGVNVAELFLISKCSITFHINIYIYILHCAPYRPFRPPWRASN